MTSVTGAYCFFDALESRLAGDGNKFSSLRWSLIFLDMMLGMPRPVVLSVKKEYLELWMRCRYYFMKFGFGSRLLLAAEGAGQALRYAARCDSDCIDREESLMRKQRKEILICCLTPSNKQNRISISRFLFFRRWSSTVRKLDLGFGFYAIFPF